jgi:hypothetical protein
MIGLNAQKRAQRVRLTRYSISLTTRQRYSHLMPRATSLREITHNRALISGKLMTVDGDWWMVIGGW